jgi:hypothetical protein
MAQASSTKTVLALGKLIVDRVFPSPAADEQADIDGTYTYLSTDFKGQDYVSGKDILEGNFMIPLFDNQTPRKQVGWISWDGLAFPDDLNNYKTVPVSVQEHMTITFGLDNDASTYNGSAISVSNGGFYNLNEGYNFKVNDGNDNYYANITITKVDAKKREVVVKSVKH